MQGGRVSVSFPLETRPLYPCKNCQIEGKPPSLCTHMPRRSTSWRIIGPITMINSPDLDNEFIRDMSGGMAAVKWVVQKVNPIEFGPIEKAINRNKINVVEQNQALGEILINQQQILSELNNL